jgi:RNA polymerase sigma-70 factor (ECF subfamily)
MGHEIQGGRDVRAQAVLSQIQHLHRHAAALARNRADAEDLVQDTLERALRALPRLRPDSNVGAWLNTLMNHRFIDAWRSNRRTRPLETADNIAAPEPELPRPWLEISDAEIKRGIDALPVSAADILRLRYYRRLSYAEIGRRLGITGDTVGTRLFRARRRLQLILTDRCLQPTPVITPLRARPLRRRVTARTAIAPPVAAAAGL